MAEGSVPSFMPEAWFLHEWLSPEALRTGDFLYQRTLHWQYALPQWYCCLCQCKPCLFKCSFQKKIRESVSVTLSHLSEFPQPPVIWLRLLWVWRRSAWNVVMPINIISAPASKRKWGSHLPPIGNSIHNFLPALCYCHKWMLPSLPTILWNSSQKLKQIPATYFSI